MKNKGIQAEMEYTINSKRLAKKITDEYNKAEEDMQNRIASELMDAAQAQLDEYLRLGAKISDTKAMKHIIYNAMTAGWNICAKHHEEIIKNLQNYDTGNN